MAERHIREHNQKQKVNTEAQKVLARRIGVKADKLSTDDLLDAAKALDLLQRCASLETAARFYLDQLRKEKKVPERQSCRGHREADHKIGECSSNTTAVPSEKKMQRSSGTSIRSDMSSSSKEHFEGR